MDQQQQTQQQQQGKKFIHLKSILKLLMVEWISAQVLSTVPSLLMFLLLLPLLLEERERIRKEEFPSRDEVR